MFFSEPKVSLPAYVAIFDTTLRDGEQMPGCALRPEEKTEIAHQLDMLGVDVIEAGFPIASEGERQAIKSITKEGLNSEICGLARSNKADIDAVISCNVDRVHTFIATSALHMEKKLKMTPEEVIEHAVSGVEYVKDHGLKSEFSAEDATRSDIEFLKKVFASAVEAGADVVDIPDTVGVAIPRTMFHIVREVKSAVNVPVAVHCHDDFGLAVANSLASVEAGAEQVHVCVNGIGERAGNASLEEVALALQVHYGIQTGIRTEEIYKTSQLVTRLMRVLIAPNKAIVGANAFAHESGIHSHGVLVSPKTYEPIAPEMVGARRKFVAGKHAGKHGVKAILESIGIYPTENQLDEIIYRVKELGDKGIKVSDADLEGVARALIGEIPSEEKSLELIDVTVVSGNKVQPFAVVRLKVNSNVKTYTNFGVGPIDASVRAVKMVAKDLVNFDLTGFELRSIGKGTEALGEVTVDIEDDESNVVSSRAVREDIVLAGIEAVIDAVNRLILTRKGKTGAK